MSQLDTNSTREIIGKVLLLDGDIVAWRAAAVSEKRHYLVTSEDCLSQFDNHKEALSFSEQLNGSLIWNRLEDRGPGFAYEALQTSLGAIIDYLEPSSTEIYLSGSKNFRKDISKEYKASREYLPKPKHLRYLRETLKLEYGAKEAEFGEADDELGIRAGEIGDGCVVASIDKDLLQIPGWHYNWVNGIISKVSEKEASFAFYQQLLTGDRTDDVVGIPGIGPVKAKYILEGGASNRDLCERVWGVYRDHYGEESSLDVWGKLCKTGSLLYILRGKHQTAWIPPYLPPEVSKIVQAN